MADASTAAETIEQPSVYEREASARDFIDLLKPRVMSLVIFTGAAGLIVAPGTMHPVLAFAAIVLLAIGAGASGSLNMWYDADIDAQMARTMNRPVPGGRLKAGDALGYGMALSFGSVALMGLLINLTAAVLLAVTIAFYVVIYTMWLKRRTPQNIVIGGAAGAFPPVIGWAAVTGTVTLESLVLFGIIFLWTPAHFWALSLFIYKDYERVDVPMLPVVKGEKVTRNQIMIYSVLMAPFGVLPSFMGFAGLAYGVVASLVGLIFLYLAFRVWRGHEGFDRKLFFFSIFYLFAVFAVLIGEHTVMALVG